MIVPSTVCTSTVDKLLFGKDEDVVESLGEFLVAHHLLGFLNTAIEHLARASFQAILQEVAKASAEVLKLDLINIIAMGWRKHSALRHAAKRTLETPGNIEVVQLATHRMTSFHRPYVNLLWDDAVLGTMHFEVNLELLVKALVVTVQSGKLAALHSGSCDITAELAVEGIEIARTESHLDMPLTIDLGGGIPLLSDAGVLGTGSSRAVEGGE